LVSITWQAAGWNNNSKFLLGLTENMDEAVGKLFHKVGEDIVMEAKHNIGQNQSINTGQLIFSVRILEEDYGKSLVVGTDAPYAEFVEFGRGPITAEEGKVLHFFTKDGEEVFTKHVGPTEPQPFLQPAVIKHTKRFSDLYVEDMGNFISKKLVNLLDTELLD